MDIYANPRVGVVVPPENPTAEPELHHLFGPSANVYTTRFPTTSGIELKRMLETYNDVLPEVLAHFGTMRVDAALVACSASHYLLGPDGDERFCTALSAGAGFPVQSSTQAILAACQALDLHRLTLVSPYQPWLTDTSRAFWEQAGLTVDDVVLVPAGTDAGGDAAYDPYQVRTEAILERLREQDPPPDTTLLFTGTGMGTLAALGELSRTDPHRTLLTSNLASAWWAYDTVGAAKIDARPHPLLQRLVDRAA